MQLPSLLGAVILTHILHHLQSSLLASSSHCTVVTGWLCIIPFPASLPHSQTAFSGGTSQINYMHLNPCLKVCFWGKPKKFRWCVHMMCPKEQRKLARGKGRENDWAPRGRKGSCVLHFSPLTLQVVLKWDVRCFGT